MVDAKPASLEIKSGSFKRVRKELKTVTGCAKFREKNINLTFT